MSTDGWLVVCGAVFVAGFWLGVFFWNWAAS